MIVLALLFLGVRIWPSGTFQGKISLGPIKQCVTVRTSRNVFGEGHVTLRGYINARDNFCIHDNMITFGGTLSAELDRAGVTLSKFDIGDSGGSVMLDTPFGTTLNVTLREV